MHCLRAVPAVGGYLEPEELMADVMEECREAAEVHLAVEVGACMRAAAAQPSSALPSCLRICSGRGAGPQLNMVVA